MHAKLGAINQRLKWDGWKERVGIQESIDQPERTRGSKQHIKRKVECISSIEALRFKLAVAMIMVI